MAQGPSD